MDALQTARKDKTKAWEEPAIVLERSLEVSAQGGGPAGPSNPFSARSGFLGPLSLSPSQEGNCG